MRLRDCAFLADECIEAAVTAWMRDNGIDVLTSNQAGVNGAPDVEVIRAATTRRRVVLTHDSDFGGIALSAKESVFGILYIRPAHIDASVTISTL